MSGGRLVVVDRSGRDVKAFPLEEGLATIGGDPVCDIRVMLPTVSPHHATVVVHSNQTVVRSVSAGETLVNGAPVSVAALRHGDELTIGGRNFRWEYNEPDRPRPLAPQAALSCRASGAVGRARARSRRATQPADGAVLVPAQRASVPGSSSGKQVAIVQPQRRDTNNQNAPASATTLASRGKRSTPSRSKSQPQRVSVLRGAVNLTKIQAPATIDHTKQAAIMLMTGHTPKGKPQSPRRPTFVVKRPSPVRRSHNTTNPKRSIGNHTSRRSTNSKTASILEITDTDSPTTATRRSGRNTTIKSPILLSPKKSSLKDPAKKPNRKTDSIKFDLSNLQDTSDVMYVTDSTKDRTCNITSEDDFTLNYSDTSTESPSPRKSIHSRSSKILEKSIGATFTQSPVAGPSTVVRESSGRRSVRGSLIVQKALENTDSNSSRYSRRSTKTMSEQSFNTVTSARKTRTLSPRTRNLESYSIVDLVNSIDSNESASSMYNSMDSNSASLKFSTPRVSGRKTRSNMAGDSTPHDSLALSPEEVVEAAGSVPEEDSPGSGARTPVLCIQQLLNQSTKRKTLPTTTDTKRPELSVKSRSLDQTSRGSRRARRSSPSEENQRSQDEELVTPKSAVKLVQSGVKNKHSTAKKPTSKRSIIDDLNESDLVKQLFNSPVKRKLSRSMTEFSRKQLLEDDEVAPLKHTRNTIAVIGTTPDNSMLNDTDAITPEVFVSPLGVEELFYEPTNLDNTFDLLMGKPRVRAYAKANSFNRSTKSARPPRNARSLHDSIGPITSNVEEWLESELKKRTYTKPTPKKSAVKTNLTRELQKLSTDTVAGNTPMRTSRVRNNSSIAQQAQAVRKKSASELYGAHTLPIKKRSLASIEANVNNLPIKSVECYTPRLSREAPP